MRVHGVSRLRRVRSARALPLLGAVLVWWTWTCALHPGPEGFPGVLLSPYAVAPLALLVGLLLGRRMADRRALSGWVGPALCVVLYLGVCWSVEPAKAPLSYANANAALAVQVLALCAICGSRSTWAGRWVPTAAALGCVAVAIANDSRLGSVVAVGVLTCALLALFRPPRRRWPIVVAALASVAGAAYGLWWLVTLALRPSWSRLIADPIRWRLWHDALALWDRNPRLGSGPGSFARFSPLAADPDTSSAHSLLMQVGAETGWVGLALLSAIWLGGLVLAASGPARVAMPAVAAWTALAGHALFDHLVDFPPVMMAAGMVLGCAAWTSRRSHPDSPADLPNRTRRA